MILSSRRAVAMAAFVCTVVASNAIAAQEVYVLDPSHTIPMFEVTHMGFSQQRGTFSNVSGRITIDRAARKGTMDIVVATASINPGTPRLLATLKGEDFFNVEKFPTMTYKSADLEFDGEQLVAVKGDLTLLGVSHPVALKVTAFKCGAHPFNKRMMCGGEAVTTIKRSEFGMKYGIPAAASDEVRIVIPFEAAREPGNAG
jgi:polyisoprenoid-binding protein YceI